MNRWRVLPHSMTSMGASVLSVALSVQRTRNDPERSNFRARLTDGVINWGCAAMPSHIAGAGVVLNHPTAVSNAVSKIDCFQILRMNNVPVPDFTTDPDVAWGWLDDGDEVVARTLSRASGGRGIEILYPGMEESEFITAPLYTKYFKKLHEYRVHVVGDSVSVRQKLRRRGANVNYKIRNHTNGFVYGRELSYVPENNMLETIGVNAVRALGLDFGAVDIAYNRHYNSAVVLEVNTAPGLVGSTIQEYADGIQRLMNTY